MPACSKKSCGHPGNNFVSVLTAFYPFIISNLQLSAFEKNVLRIFKIICLVGKKTVKDLVSFQDINVQPVSSGNFHRRY